MTEATARIRYPTGTLALGSDGFAPVSRAVAVDGCCPEDPLCAPFCGLACSFVDLLPSGPMWDRQKAEAKAGIEECGGVPGSDCTTMASFAVYGARVLQDSLQSILWPSIRESRPETAVTTLDDWLMRYGWQDCYRTYCRDPYLARFSPYETPRLPCGSEFCPPEFPPEFECALKHAILMALVRASRGVVKNLDGVNWVIEPLGAMVSPRRPWPDIVSDYLAGSCPEETEGPPCFCSEAELEICNISDTLPGCPSAVCGEKPVPVAAVQTYQCAAEPPVQLYPGVIAAECIVRSLLARRCPNIIHRCEV